MSRANYMCPSRAESAYSIIIVVEELTTHIFTITNNEKQFPKAYRYTLVSDMRNTCLELNKRVYRACSLKPHTVKDYEKLRKYQDKIFDLIIDLKALIILSMNIVNLRNPEHLAKLYMDTVEAFNRMVKNTKRAAKKTAWLEAMTPDEHKVRKERMRDQMARKMDHDDCGFIILKRRIQDQST